MNVQKQKQASTRYSSVFIAGRFKGFKRPSRFAFKSYYWAHVVFAREYLKAQKTKFTRLIGKRVQVDREQKRRIGGPKCPGRTGIVSGLNSVDNTLIYVDLDATKRGKARRETFWLHELIFV